MPAPLTPNATRALLDRLGLHPSRHRGQNFLVDGNIVRKSLELAGVAPGDRIVEVGPGLGTLTQALLEAGAEVWAVELDRGLHAYLQSEIVPNWAGRFHLIEGDALEHPLADLPDAAAAPFKIVANLPYAISTPWMEAVLNGPLPERMVLMLQLEAAQRYMAAHGSKSFGAISVLLQSSFSIEPGHRVSSGCFWPRPDVDSFLLNLRRREQAPRLSPERYALIRQVFMQRRKQLLSCIREHAPEHLGAWTAWIAASGLPPTVRAEEVPAAVWMRWATK